MRTEVRCVKLPYESHLRNPLWVDHRIICRVHLFQNHVTSEELPGCLSAIALLANLHARIPVNRPVRLVTYSALLGDGHSLRVQKNRHNRFSLPPSSSGGQIRPYGGTLESDDGQ